MKNILPAFLISLTIAITSCSGTARTLKSASIKDPTISSVKQDTIRVMTYNIHHCNPPSKPGLIDLEAIEKAIRMQNPDILALQEVDVNTGRSGKYNQAEDIAKRLNMDFFFGKAIDYDGGEYGVAILSKFPISEQSVLSLPTNPETNGEPRILATVKLSLPDGTFIRFGNTHLDAQKASVNRELQIREISKYAGMEKLPFIIAGDFNATPGTNIISILDRSFQRTCQQCEPTIPEKNPVRTIDFIAFAPQSRFEVITHVVIDEQYASDHRPVLAVIKRQ